MSEVKITVVVKTPREMHEFDVNANAPVSNLKEDVSIKFNTDLERICLIFAGKILKDDDTLNTHKIKDGGIIHLVIRNPVNETKGDSGTSTEPKTTIHSLGESLNSLADIFDNDLYNQLQSELLGNQSIIIEILNFPVVQQLFHNPEQVQQMMDMMQTNSQLRNLMDNNPEIAHLFNNPQIFRESLELARNPPMMQELIRTTDRAILNLESIPGGMSALERDFRDIHEPIIEAANEQNNPYINNTRLSYTSTLDSNPQRGVENRNPLPNPWTSESTESITTPSSRTSLLSILDDNFISTVLPVNPSPEVRAILDSPRGLDALLRIREGIEELRTLVNEANTSGTRSSTLTSHSSQSSDIDIIPNMVNNLQNINISSGNLYHSQIEQLQAMGFMDVQANIQALTETSGNLEAAVTWLLENYLTVNQNINNPNK